MNNPFKPPEECLRSLERWFITGTVHVIGPTTSTGSCFPAASLTEAFDWYACPKGYSSAATSSRSTLCCPSNDWLPNHLFTLANANDAHEPGLSCRTTIKPGAPASGHAWTFDREGTSSWSEFTTMTAGVFNAYGMWIAGPTGSTSSAMPVPTSSQGTPPSMSPVPADGNSEGGGLRTGIIAGASIASFAGVLLGLGAAFFIAKRKRLARDKVAAGAAGEGSDQEAGRPEKSLLHNEEAVLHAPLSLKDQWQLDSREDPSKTHELHADPPPPQEIGPGR